MSRSRQARTSPPRPSAPTSTTPPGLGSGRRPWWRARAPIAHRGGPPGGPRGSPRQGRRSRSGPGDPEARGVRGARPIRRRRGRGGDPAGPHRPRHGRSPRRIALVRVLGGRHACPGVAPRRAAAARRRAQRGARQPGAHRSPHRREHRRPHPGARPAARRPGGPVARRRGPRPRRRRPGSQNAVAELIQRYESATTAADHGRPASTPSPTRAAARPSP